ncbi:unnamed protein product [Timema podura]|uniref:Uncharacterized protein n=1 Tax=Timema podura TaxID=61482 RepID=A0ABN7P060_TIMPD|nr:unnamed protein product [Timema podura]
MKGGTRFIGMCACRARFIPKFYELATPRNWLKRKGVPFVWGTEQSAFDALKSKFIFPEKTTFYYNPCGLKASDTFLLTKVATLRKRLKPSENNLRDLYNVISISPSEMHQNICPNVKGIERQKRHLGVFYYKKGCQQR